MLPSDSHGIRYLTSDGNFITWCGLKLVRDSTSRPENVTCEGCQAAEGVYLLRKLSGIEDVFEYQQWTDERTGERHTFIRGEAESFNVTYRDDGNIKNVEYFGRIDGSTVHANCVPRQGESAAQNHRGFTNRKPTAPCKVGKK
jgi:hypothetical protein